MVADHENARTTQQLGAVEGERQLPYNYSHFFYLREDNVFVDPQESLVPLARYLMVYATCRRPQNWKNAERKLAPA